MTHKYDLHWTTMQIWKAESKEQKCKIKNLECMMASAVSKYVIDWSFPFGFCLWEVDDSNWYKVVCVTSVFCHKCLTLTFMMKGHKGQIVLINRWLFASCVVPFYNRIFIIKKRNTNKSLLKNDVGICFSYFFKKKWKMYCSNIIMWPLYTCTHTIHKHWREPGQESIFYIYISLYFHWSASTVGSCIVSRNCSWFEP